ncbi:hypothetical protein L1987_35456 [Smallanthus sonchifolius]|uniref:Uncharacterized protein n=1 Tax=Smallanthus sonchifolius TaxID=185202 RepID=A0ACB9HXW0_9ASTR|nr:hypothetical protein L1987_35456 [Smallanthus sonchifolius]
MGANSSLLTQESSDGSSHLAKLKLGDILESCVALVLSYSDPLEICKFARLNRALRATFSANFIWDAKLPSNFNHLEFWLDKRTRRLCISIASKALTTSRIDDL